MIAAYLFVELNVIERPRERPRKLEEESVTNARARAAPVDEVVEERGRN